MFGFVLHKKLDLKPEIQHLVWECKYRSLLIKNSLAYNIKEIYQRIPRNNKNTMDRNWHKGK